MAQKTIRLVWTDAPPDIDEPDRWVHHTPDLEVCFEGFDKPEDVYPVMLAGLKVAEQFLIRPKVIVHSEEAKETN